MAGFNINGSEEIDEHDARNHQDIIDLFYRVGQKPIRGVKSYPKRGKATLDYDEDYLDRFFRGSLYPMAVKTHQDIPKDPPPRFCFDLGDIERSVGRYHHDAEKGYLLTPNQNICLHEFLLRDYGSTKKIRILSPFLYYFFSDQKTPLYTDLDSDQKHLVNYVTKKWEKMKGVRPIEDVNHLALLPVIVDSFVDKFFDIIPLQQRWSAHGVMPPWPLSCLELLLDDFLNTVSILGGGTDPVHPGVLISKRVWGQMFMSRMRRVTGLSIECLPDWTDLEDVDTSSCWCRS